MFSRLFSSARTFVNPQPQNKLIHKSQIHTTTETMVMTRNKQADSPAEESELDEENSINVYVPMPKRKSEKISRDEQSMTTGGDGVTSSPSSKKRKILPVRAKDGEPILVNTRPVVEIPAKRATPQLEPELAIETQSPSSVKKHKKFGSEEPEQDFFSTAREEHETPKQDTKSIDEAIDAEDSDRSSDDDAPEEVGAQAAARDAKFQVQSAAEAIKGFRKKRKERSSRAGTTPRKSGTDFDDVEEDDTNTEIHESAVQSFAAKREDPDLLPEKVHDSDDDNKALPRVPTSSKPRKTKFEYSVEKAPKDRRVGSTTYRVTKFHSKNLAPKSDHNAKVTKESWLQGRSVKGIGANRRPMKQGFFKK